MRVAFEPVWTGNPYHAELEKSLRSLGVDVLCPQSLKSFYADYIAGAEKVDVVHIHALPRLCLSPRNLVRYVLFYWRLSRLRKRGVRLVWTIHDFQNHEARYKAIENFIERRFSSYLHALIVHGNSAKQIIESRWGKNGGRRVSVIQHGHYIESYKNDVTRETGRASLGLEQSNVVFLFFGLIRPYKGVFRMVKAFKRCSNDNLRLIIAGRPITNAIKKQTQRAVEGDERIRFVPETIKDDDIQTYMNACDAVVLPYRRVLTSGAAMLAMSFGKPCIAPRAGCMTDMLDEKGAVFFDPLIDRDLERAFREILASPQKLRAMGQHNLKRAASWDWNTIGKATAAVYEQCLAA